MNKYKINTSCSWELTSAEQPEAWRRRNKEKKPNCIKQRKQSSNLRLFWQTEQPRERKYVITSKKFPNVFTLRSQSFQEKEKNKEHKIQIQSSLVLKTNMSSCSVSCISGFCSFLGEKCKRLGRWHMETCFWSQSPSDQLGGKSTGIRTTDWFTGPHTPSFHAVCQDCRQAERIQQPAMERAAPNQEANLT